MLTYTCPTCGNSFDVSVTDDHNSYMAGNKVVVLKSESADCLNCTNEIQKSIEAKRAEIKAKRQV